MDHNGNIKTIKPQLHLLEGVRLINTNQPIDFISDPNYLSHKVSLLYIDDQKSNSTDELIKWQIISGIRQEGMDNKINPHMLSKRLQIPLEMAKQTLRITTQLGRRTSSEPTLNRKYRTNDRMLRYNRVSTFTFMDTMFASARGGKSLRGNTACQVFATEFGHVFAVLMENKTGQRIAQAIKQYFKSVGVPDRIICDQAREQVKGEAARIINDSGSTLVELEK